MQKYLFWGDSKEHHQTECSRLERSSVVKFLVARKSKPNEIYKRMYDLCWEPCCCKKKKKRFTNEMNIGLLQRTWIIKDSPWNGNILTLQDWKSPGLRPVNKVMLRIFWDIKGYITIDIFENIAAVHSASSYQIPWQNSSYQFNEWMHDIDMMVRVFANGSGDPGSIPGQVIPKTQKWYLMPPCLTLSIIRYVSRVKWSNPGKGVAPSPTS